MMTEVKDITKIIKDALLDNLDNKISEKPNLHGNHEIQFAHVDEWANVSGRQQLYLEINTVVTNSPSENNPVSDRFIISVEAI